MIFTDDDVQHIAHLACLQLTKEEVTLYREQLSAILEYANRLSMVDTSSVFPIAGVLDSQNKLRSDEPHLGLSKEELLMNASLVDKGYFRVLSILNSGTNG